MENIHRNSPHILHCLSRTESRTSCWHFPIALAVVICLRKTWLGALQACLDEVSFREWKQRRTNILMSCDYGIFFDRYPGPVAFISKTRSLVSYYLSQTKEWNLTSELGNKNYLSPLSWWHAPSSLKAITISICGITAGLITPEFCWVPLPGLSVLLFNHHGSHQQ